MVKQERVFLKSYLTFRGKLPGWKKQKWYVVFGRFEQRNGYNDKYFLRIFKKSNELEMKNSLHFDIDEFCGLEVGCTLEKSRWFKNIRNRTFLRLLFTEGRTLEFIVENEKDQPLIAFRAIETWRKKLSRELGYRCYWNVYMCECGQDWSEGYGKLHLTHQSLSIASTDKLPVILGHWQLRDAKRCNYTKNNHLIIRFLGQDEPLQFETEDAEEIAKTLAKNMPELASQAIYMAMPEPTDEPPHRVRSRKSVRHKLQPPPSPNLSEEGSDRDSIDSLESANTWVPITPDSSSEFSFPVSEHMSLGEMETCERRRNHTVHPPPSPGIKAKGPCNGTLVSPSKLRDKNPSFGQYESAAPVIPPGSPDCDQAGVSQPNHGRIKQRPPRMNRQNNIDLSVREDVTPIPSPRILKNGNKSPFSLTENGLTPHMQPPPRPPKSPMIERKVWSEDPGIMPPSPLPDYHPQPPRFPPPRPDPKQNQNETIKAPIHPRNNQASKRPVAMPRKPKSTDGGNGSKSQTDYLMFEDMLRMNDDIKSRTLPLTKKLSRSLDTLTSIEGWHLTRDNHGGGRIIDRPISRDQKSRIPKKPSFGKWKPRPTQMRPSSSYSDADIEYPSDDKIYDVSHILEHLKGHIDDRPYRVSTMWYVNMLSSFDKPDDRARLSSAINEQADNETPPPLPPRDKEPIFPQPFRTLPAVSSEYWSAMNICLTLRMVLQRDAPHPDTLLLSRPLRNKVCMHLYISNLGTRDWRDLADTIGLEHQAVEIIEAFTAHHQQQTAAEIVLRHWQHRYNRYGYDPFKCRKRCTRQELVRILKDMQRYDVITLIEEDSFKMKGVR